jgi:hypothetical protein
MEFRKFTRRYRSADATEGDEVQIFWSVTAIASLFTIIFMLTRW